MINLISIMKLLVTGGLGFIGSNFISRILENQKELVSLFKKYTFDEMKDELQGWLKPSDEDGGKQTEVKAAPSKQKENIDSKLDQLFD